MKYYEVTKTKSWEFNGGICCNTVFTIVIARLAAQYLLMLENLTAGFGEVPDATRGYDVQDTSSFAETLSFADALRIQTRVFF